MGLEGTTETFHHFLCIEFSVKRLRRPAVLFYKNPAVLFHLQLDIGNIIIAELQQIFNIQKYKVLSNSGSVETYIVTKAHQSLKRK